MKVNDLLPSLKANKHTYKGLNDKSTRDFKRLYLYLKKYKEKEIYLNYFMGLSAMKGQIEYWQTNKNETDYIRKYKIMELISRNIKH